MKKVFFILIALFIFATYWSNGQTRKIQLLEDNWQFINQEVVGAEKPETITSSWEIVNVPHDWAIKGPFDKEIDAQKVRVQQDMDTVSRMRTGRTGALPHIGTGGYRKTFLWLRIFLFRYFRIFEGRRKPIGSAIGKPSKFIALVSWCRYLPKGSNYSKR